MMLPIGLDFDYNPGMSRIIRLFYPILAAMALLLVAHAAYSQQIKQTSAKPTVSISGKELFREYCAVCHGVSGRGDGPAAHALKTIPTDLTGLARANSGRFPEAQFLALMQGDKSVAAHGSTEMPIWGSVFSKMSPSPELTQTRLHALLNYIEEMQGK